MPETDSRSQRAIENLGILNTLMRLSLSDEPLATILNDSLVIIHQTSWLRILPKGGIFLVDAEQGDLVLSASHNMSPELDTLCARVKFGQCLCGRAAQSKQIEFASCVDHRHDISFSGMAPHGHYSIPIMDENEDLLGVIVLYLQHGHVFDNVEVRFLKIVADTLASVIKRKRAEETNERLARIVDEAANEIFLVDAVTNRFVMANRVACNNLGFSCKALRQMSFLDISPSLTAADMQQMLQPLLQGDVDHVRYETIHRREDGSDYFVSVNLQMLRSGDRQIFAAIAEDITERKRTESKLAEYRDHLERQVAERTHQLEVQADELALALDREKEINERQRQFVSMVSHEFRTPLTIIDGSTQLLKARREQWQADDVARRLEKIRGAVLRMTELIDSTLSADRFESGKINFSPVDDCDLRRLIGEVCARFKDVSHDHRIELRLDGLSRHIYGDPIFLDQIFTNLMSNAIKYSPRNPDIIVTGTSEDGKAVVSVRDFGLGIDDADMPHMFERFFRARSSSGIAGTGIGLNLVKMLVEQHNGSIEVESQRGKGSCFTVRLPCRAPVAAADEAVEVA